MHQIYTIFVFLRYDKIKILSNQILAF